MTYNEAPFFNDYAPRSIIYGRQDDSSRISPSKPPNPLRNWGCQEAIHAFIRDHGITARRPSLIQSCAVGEPLRERPARDYPGPGLQKPGSSWSTCNTTTRNILSSTRV
jgi:hypothetical protein